MKNKQERMKQFKLVCKLEPQVAALYKEIKSIKNVDETFCANEVWYGYGDRQGQGFKQRMLKLVGWSRPLIPRDGPTEEFLHSSRAYEVTYDTFYDTLPDCRSCNCLNLSVFLR